MKVTTKKLELLLSLIRVVVDGEEDFEVDFVVAVAVGKGKWENSVVVAEAALDVAEFELEVVKSNLQLERVALLVDCCCVECRRV